MKTPTPLDQAIFCTLLYGDIFDFPMTAPEIHHFLMYVPASLNAVQSALATPSDWLQDRIVADAPYYAVAGRHHKLFARRRERDRISAALLPKARRYGALVGYLPFVRMVALTGSLAMHNAASPRDDLDYLLVVRTGRVWTARLLAVVIVRVARLWGISICPNYVLAEDALEQEPHSMYMAHEITQMIPLVGRQTHDEIRANNRWTDYFLPNAQGVLYQEADHTLSRPGRWLKRLVEWSLSGAAGNRLERWEMQRKLRKLERQPATEEVQLDANHVKGHFIDYGHLTMQRFHQRLEIHGVSLPEIADSAAD